MSDCLNDKCNKKSVALIKRIFSVAVSSTRYWPSRVDRRYLVLRALSYSFLFVGLVSITYPSYPKGIKLSAFALMPVIVWFGALNLPPACLIGIKFALSIASRQKKDQNFLGRPLASNAALYVLSNVPKRRFTKPFCSEEYEAFDFT